MNVIIGSRVLRNVVLGASLAAWTAGACAQTGYPNRLIRFIVPLAAEGSEVIGSTPAQAMSAFTRDIAQFAELIRRAGIKQ
jgi:hypothetical protein